MRIEPRSIDSFLSRPPAVRAVLFHGADEALVRDRADRLTLSVVGARDDPFRVAWLFRDDHARLAEEASAIAMMGGRRVIRVRDVPDGLAPSVLKAITAPGDSVVILEYDALQKRSKLRTALEDSPLAAVVACYPLEGAALRDLAQQAFATAGVTLGPGALPEFLARIGPDAAAVRGEVEKLALYAGAARRIDVADVEAAVGDMAQGSAEDALFAVTAGRLAALDSALDAALDGGTAPVALCRMALGHLTRLQQAVDAVARGEREEQAARGVRPPVIFTRLPAFTAAIPLWSSARLVAALAAVTACELACKQTGARDVLLVRHLLLTLAQHAARGRR